MTTYALEPEVEVQPQSRWVIEDVPKSPATPSGRPAPGRSGSNGDTPAASGSKLASFIDATGLPEFWSRTNANVKAGWDALKESPDQLWKAVQSVAQSVREDRQGNREGAMSELGGAAANVAQAGMGIAAFPFTPLFAPVQAGFEQAAGVLPKPDQPIMKIGDASITPRQLAGIVGTAVAAGAIPSLIPSSPASVPKEYILKTPSGKMGKVAVTTQGNPVFQPITNPRTARQATMERAGRTTVNVPDAQFTGLFSGNPEQARAQFIQEHKVPVSTSRPAPGLETPPDVPQEAPPAASIAPTIDELPVDHAIASQNQAEPFMPDTTVERTPSGGTVVTSHGSVGDIFAMEKIVSEKTGKDVPTLRREVADYVDRKFGQTLSRSDLQAMHDNFYFRYLKEASELPSGQVERAALPAPPPEVAATGQPRGGAVLSEPVVPEAGVQPPTEGGVPPDMAPVALDAPAAGSVGVTPPTAAAPAVPAGPHVEGADAIIQQAGGPSPVTVPQTENLGRPWSGEKRGGENEGRTLHKSEENPNFYMLNPQETPNGRPIEPPPTAQEAPVPETPVPAPASPPPAQGRRAPRRGKIVPDAGSPEAGAPVSRRLRGRPQPVATDPAAAGPVVPVAPGSGVPAGVAGPGIGTAGAADSGAGTAMDAVHGPGVGVPRISPAERRSLDQLGWSRAQVTKMDPVRAREFIEKKQGPSSVVSNQSVGTDTVKPTSETVKLGQNDTYVVDEMVKSVKMATEEPLSGTTRSRVPVKTEGGEWTGEFMSAPTLKPEWMRIEGDEFYDSKDVLKVLDKLKAGQWPTSALQERIANTIEAALRDDAKEEKERAFYGMDPADIAALEAKEAARTVEPETESGAAKAFFGEVNRLAGEEATRPPVPAAGARAQANQPEMFTGRQMIGSSVRNEPLKPTAPQAKTDGPLFEPRPVEEPALPMAGVSPEAEYDAALVASRKASQTFRQIQQDYRAKRIGDDEFLAGKKAFEASSVVFDAAERKFIDAKNEPALPDTALRPYGRKVQELTPEHLDTQGGLWWVDKTEGDQVTQEPAHGAEVTTKYGRAWTNGHIVELGKPSRGIVIDPERMQSKSAGVEKVLTPPATRVVLEPVGRQGGNVLLRRSDGVLVMIRGDYFDHFATRQPGAEFIQDAKASNAPVLVMKRGKPRGAMMGMNFEETPEMRALADKPAEPESTGTSGEFSILR